MTKPIAGPDPNPVKPRYAPPPGACDAHCHILGPAARFPYAPERRYTPPDSPKEKLRALHDHLGLSRAVLVQASCHGGDNRAMLDAISWSKGAWRGVAMVDDDMSEKALADLHAGGARAVRFNFPFYDDFTRNARKKPRSSSVSACPPRFPRSPPPSMTM